MNAATSPNPRTRDETALLRPDETKAFDVRSAQFGRNRSVPTAKEKTNDFYFVDKTRTKDFATRDFSTKEAAAAGRGFDTKAAPVKESWFSRLTARSKSYDTRGYSDAGKTTETQVLPGSDRSFVAKGRRQADLDKKGAAGAAGGGEGESWSGDLKPLTIQDVKTLLNKN